MTLVRFGLLVVFSVSTLFVSGQAQRVGGPCEGCEAVHESPVPFGKIGSSLKMPSTAKSGRKPLTISGIVYKIDGKTPASGVVLYVYHTDETGHYPKKGDETGWGKRHGYLRGWLRTNAAGEYSFTTFRPAPYPNATEPAHIHITVKEPGLTEYYLDEFLFADDPFLTPEKRRTLSDRGGSGVLTLKKVGTTYTAERMIFLGRNIPNYPTNR